MLRDGQCVSVASTGCPAGQALIGDACLPFASCGANTTLQNGLCVATSTSGSTCGPGTSQMGTTCQPDLTSLCGTDTKSSNGKCITALSCGSGSSRSGNECVATPVGVTCGSGTQLQGQQCVALNPLTCGSGTAQMANQCVVNLGQVCSTDTTGAGGNRCVSTLSCGMGTAKSGNQCTATSQPTVSCGSGTTLQGNQCVVSSSGPLASFLALSTTAKASAQVYRGTYTTTYQERFVVTTLSQGNADAWAATGNAMIGSGNALHLSGGSSSSAGIGYYTIRNDSNAAGTACAASAVPDPLVANGQISLNYFSWANGVSTPVACAKSGTVRVAAEINGNVTVTINAALSDGSTLVDKVYTF